MAGEFVIERAPGGFVDRVRAYEVIVDGEMRAKLRRGESKLIEVDREEIEVFVRIDWCRSRALLLNVTEGSRPVLRCRPRSLATVFYGVTFGRDDYVLLNLA